MKCKFCLLLAYPLSIAFSLSDFVLDGSYFGIKKNENNYPYTQVSAMDYSDLR